MNKEKRKLVSIKEIEKAQKKARIKAEKHGLKYDDVLTTTKVRVKHPLLRTVVFLLASLFLYGAIQTFIFAVYWVSVIFLVISLVFYYVAFYGDRRELKDCITESGEAALDISFNILDV